jgi:hypothetical protein
MDPRSIQRVTRLQLNLLDPRQYHDLLTVLWSFGLVHLLVMVHHFHAQLIFDDA